MLLSVEIRFPGSLLPVVDAVVLCPFPMVCELTLKEGAATALGGEFLKCLLLFGHGAVHISQTTYARYRKRC